VDIAIDILAKSAVNQNDDMAKSFKNISLIVTRFFNRSFRFFFMKFIPRVACHALTEIWRQMAKRQKFET